MKVELCSLFFKRYNPTNWHTSAPSHAPIVTSNNSSFYFIQQSEPLISKDFRECWIKSTIQIRLIDVKNRLSVV